MIRARSLTSLFSVVLSILILLTACVSPSQKTTSTITPSATTIPTLTAAPTQTSTPTKFPTSTPTSIPPTAEPTQDPGIFVTAQVWRSSLQAPVILYHRFLPESAASSTRTKMTLDEFRAQIQALYDAGYSLIPMERWLAGDINLPNGRRPLILTMDDLFFADQIYLDPDGTPSQRTGLGILWDFAQRHPDFGFSAALFYNLGDKYYGNIKTPSWFIVGNGWQDALAKAIVWCIEHGAIPYNHTYMHSFLDQLGALAIKDELWRNDVELRKFLTLAQREDLIPRLDNYIALPYGVWPSSKGLTDYMLAYRDPQDKPVTAVFEAGYFFEKRYLPAPFEPGFDRLRIPRITTNTKQSIDFLVNNRSLFPETEECKIGPFITGQEDNIDTITKQIQAALRSGQCFEGTYRVGKHFFDVSNGNIKAIWSVQPATPTPP